MAAFLSWWLFFLPALNSEPGSEEIVIKEERQLMPVGVCFNDPDTLAIAVAQYSSQVRVRHTPQALAVVVWHEKQLMPKKQGKAV